MCDLMRQREDAERHGTSQARTIRELAAANRGLRQALEEIRLETVCDRAWRLAMNALHPELKDAA